MLASEMGGQKAHHVIKYLHQFHTFQNVQGQFLAPKRILLNSSKLLGAFALSSVCLYKANSKISKLKHNAIVYQTANKIPHFGYT